MSSTTMKTKGKKQNKFLRGITAPFRALNGFYVSIMFGCAAHFPNDLGPQASVQIPRNFSVNSSVSVRERIGREEEELRELIRVASTKLNGVPIKVEMRKPASVVPTAAELRSYSVGVGKIGRIDEDKPCDFKEGDTDSCVYTRSRSYAVTRRTMVF